MQPAGLRMLSKVPDLYGLLTFELLHDLHLGILNLHLEIMMEYVSFDTGLTDLLHMPYQ